MRTQCCRYLLLLVVTFRLCYLSLLFWLKIIFYCCNLSAFFIDFGKKIYSIIGLVSVALYRCFLGCRYPKGSVRYRARNFIEVLALSFLREIE